MKRAFVLPALAVLLLGAQQARAQGGAIVQSTPPAMAVERLNNNLTRLSRSPTDVDALVGAGMAAYDLGDAQAANGFFMRADMVNPRIGRVKLGLALAALQLKQPREAADYFDAAAQLGEPATAYLAERALAYDLVGQQDKAQRDHAAALRARPGDKAIIRDYAVSLGASGKIAEAEAMIRPLLFQSDRGAWRDRVMILAMNGRATEARRIAQTVMPRPLADSMDSYLQRMATLSPAQKVAAARYGQFPADTLRAAPTASPPPVQAAIRSERNGHRRKSGREASAAADQQDDSKLIAAMPRGDAPAVVQPDPAPQPVPRPLARSGREPVVDDDPDGWTAAERAVRAQSRPEPRPQARPASIPNSRAARTVMGPPAPAAVSVPPAQVAGIQPAPVRPVAAPVPAPAAVPQPRSLAAIMAGIDVPESERQSSTPAVDLEEIARMKAERRKAEAAAVAKAAADKAKKEAAAKAKAEAAAKAKAEAEEKARIKANPARYWVQVATGRDVGALAFDLRRLRKTYAALADQDGWTADWGATRRLLVGPFATAAKAKSLDSDLRKAGADSFIWQSEAGEVVTALSRK